MSSFIRTISIAPLQVHFYSEALPTQHGYCAGVSHRSATGNCELRTYPRSLHIRGGYRAKVEPTTLRLKAIDSTNAPPRHHAPHSVTTTSTTRPMPV